MIPVQVRRYAMMECEGGEIEFVDDCLLVESGRVPEGYQCKRARVRVVVGFVTPRAVKRRIYRHEA